MLVSLVSALLFVLALGLPLLAKWVDWRTAKGNPPWTFGEPPREDRSLDI